MPTLIPLAQPLQRSRIPLTTPPPRPISTPLSLPSMAKYIYEKG
jgi:hypothetical protein